MAESRCRKITKPEKNKVLDILILGGGPIGLFAGYKLLKRGNNVTIFEKRLEYTRHNILPLKETTELETLCLIPSEIMEDLNQESSFANINAYLNSHACYKNILREKPYLMASSRTYYIVLNELEKAYEKNFKICGGCLIKPNKEHMFTDIKIVDHQLTYCENSTQYSIDLSKFDIILINDGANSFYRKHFFSTTSYTEHVEKNIICYGLDDYGAIKTTEEIDEVKPFAYGMIFIYDIENKEEFQEKFRSIDKLQRRMDFDSIYELNRQDNFLKGLSVKEIVIENRKKQQTPSKLQSQNFFRMFISENYLYLSFMINPRDVGDFSNHLKPELTFDELPESIQIYLQFALYYYDLSELIDPRSKNITINIFPLTFTYVNQSCTFIKKPSKEEFNSIRRTDSAFGYDVSQLMKKDKVPDKQLVQNHYQFVALCGDAMVCGNFHSGIVLNRNLVAVNTLCISIDEYIDAYPKDANGNLDNNFLRLLFFNGNLSNQRTRNEIITKSIASLINFKALDEDTTILNLADVLFEMKELILCKNCGHDNESLCINSASFIKFLIDNSDKEVLQRILKYLLLPDKYKYTDYLEKIRKLEVKKSALS